MLFMICLNCGAVILDTPDWRVAHSEWHASLGQEYSPNQFETIELVAFPSRDVRVKRA